MLLCQSFRCHALPSGRFTSDLHCCTVYSSFNSASLLYPALTSRARHHPFMAFCPTAQSCFPIAQTHLCCLSCKHPGSELSLHKPFTPLNVANALFPLFGLSLFTLTYIFPPSSSLPLDLLPPEHFPHVSNTYVDDSGLFRTLDTLSADYAWSCLFPSLSTLPQECLTLGLLVTLFGSHIAFGASPLPSGLPSLFCSPPAFLRTQRGFRLAQLRFRLAEQGFRLAQQWFR